MLACLAVLSNNPASVVDDTANEIARLKECHHSLVLMFTDVLVIITLKVSWN
jgi:hypothetical protein